MSGGRLRRQPFEAMQVKALNELNPSLPPHSSWLWHAANNRLCLLSSSDEALPRYAILSHIWGADTDKVTFGDLTNGTGANKLGSEKVRFCAEQAKQDGLRCFWIDTCCIDKPDETELSLAISSIFPRYRNSTHCYVYLLNVSTAKRDLKGSDCD